MDMDQAAVFLSGSILTAIGFVVVIIAVVFVNNVLHKYWKPVRIFTADSFNVNPPQRFETPKEIVRIAPHLDDKKEPK